MQQFLFLARHAHALDDAPSDDLRPLSAKGHRQCGRLAKSLRGSGLWEVDCIWQSGLVRSRETAEDLREGLDLKIELTQRDGLAPFDDPYEIAAELSTFEQNCLIVGHEPNLSLLASLLLVGHSDFQRVTFPKASILCLSRLSIAGQSTPWQIEWHINHKHCR